MEEYKRCKSCGSELRTKSRRERWFPKLFQGSGFCFLCVKMQGLKYLKNNPDSWWYYNEYVIGDKVEGQSDQSD